jgi:glycosyltransferase involved in cell wall biosynthesis
MVLKRFRRQDGKGMRINIIGQHPIPQPGFTGVMSLYEALWFSRLGDDVVLYLPFPDEARRDALQKTLSDGFDGLEKLGGAFRIEPVLHDGNGLRPSDVTVWQSREHDEWNALYPVALERSQIITKNFPKLVPHGPNTLHPNVIGQLAQFDFVALALREDLAALQSVPEFFEGWSHRIDYVPRGADPLLLHPGRKVGRRPVIAVDTPNTGDQRAIRHYLKPLTRLKQEFADLEVITLGRDIGLDWATRVPFGRFDQIYDQFFNRAWLYLTIDYRYSPQHLQGTIHHLDPERWSRKAVYEVQNIEAQMAGAVVVGHDSNLIPELFEPGESGVLFRDFSDDDEIFDRLAGVIDGYDHHRAAARAWALRNHNWEHCIGIWREGLSELVHNDYRRNATTTSLPQRALAPDNVPKKNPAPAPIEQPVSNPVEAPRLRMSPAEQEFFLRYLNGACAVIEYGSGGSTLAAVQSPAERIFSVESDQRWLSDLQQDPVIAHAVATGRLTLVHVDLGPTHVWGYPETGERRAQWPGYAEEVWLEHVSQPIKLVLVDGRFRVYAAAYSLARLSPDGVLLFHDFWDREHYRAILAFADVVDRCETFAALRPKATGAPGLSALEPFRFDPR